MGKWSASFAIVAEGAPDRAEDIFKIATSLDLNMQRNILPISISNPKVS